MTTFLAEIALSVIAEVAHEIFSVYPPWPEGCLVKVSRGMSSGLLPSPKLFKAGLGTSGLVMVCRGSGSGTSCSCLPVYNLGVSLAFGFDFGSPETFILLKALRMGVIPASLPPARISPQHVLSLFFLKLKLKFELRLRLN